MKVFHTDPLSTKFIHSLIETKVAKQLAVTQVNPIPSSPSEKRTELSSSIPENRIHPVTRISKPRRYNLVANTIEFPPPQSRSLLLLKRAEPPILIICIGYPYSGEIEIAVTDLTNKRPSLSQLLHWPARKYADQESTR